MPRMSKEDVASRRTAFKTASKSDAAARSAGEADFNAKPTDRADGKEAKVDGMQNVFTAMGTFQDRASYTQFKPSRILNWQILEAMYVGDGVVRKIIDKYVEEMTRKPYAIEGDTDGTLYAMMESKGLNYQVRELLRWSRLYGGSLGGLLINDGSADLSKPLNVKRIKSVDSMQVWNRWRTWWSLTDAYLNPLLPNYMTPSRWTVIPILGTPFTIHESRTVRMDGLPVPDTVRVRNLGWGDSIMQSVFEQVRQFATVFNGTERIIDGFVQEVLSIKNLANLLQTDEGTLIVKNRLELLDLSSSNYHTKLLDAEQEAFTKSASTVTGLRELLDLFMQILCAVVNMPKSVFFGISDGGLNSNGESQTRLWYDSLAADQQRTLKPAYTQLINLIIASDEYTGPVKPNPVIRFEPLWQMDELEDSQRRYNVARTDAIYHGLGLTGPEILDSHFGGDHYSPEIHLDESIESDARETKDVNPVVPLSGDGEGENNDLPPQGKKAKAKPAVTEAKKDRA